MKKVLAFLLCIVVSAVLYARDTSFSVGYENAFGFRYAEASSVTSPIADTQDVRYQETNFTIAPGATLSGRFLGDNGLGGFFRASFLFPLRDYYDVSVSPSSPEFHSSSGTWQPDDGLMRAFNIGGGFSAAIPVTQRFNVVLDGGLVVEINSTKSRDFTSVGAGVLCNLAFQYTFANHLRLETGIKAMVTGGTGEIGSSSSNYSISTDDLTVTGAPYITFGVVFGDGIGRFSGTRGERRRGNNAGDAPGEESPDSSLAGGIGDAEYAVDYNNVDRETVYKLSKLWLVDTFIADKTAVTFDDMELGVIAGRVTVDNGVSAYRCNFKMDIGKNKIVFSNFTNADGSRISSRNGTAKVKVWTDELAESYQKMFD